MILRIYPLLVLLLFLPDFYIHHFYLKKNKKEDKASWLIRLHWIPSIILFILSTLLLYGDNFTEWRVRTTALFFIAFLIVTIPKCLFLICSLIGLGISSFIKKYKTKVRIKQLFDFSGITVALIGAFFMIYGSSYGWKRFQIKEIPFSHPHIPESFNGYRIVQISDFHIGTIRPYPQTVKHAISMINSLNPDLIVFTGDLINNEASELDGIENILADLRAKDGVYSVLGNHDYSLYRKWQNKTEQAQNLSLLKQKQQDMGWKLLLNEHQIIRCKNDSIALIGVENCGNPPFPSFGNLSKAKEGTDHMFQILLSHDPSHWRNEVLPETKIALTLSGHTHSMQFKIGNFSPSSWFYPEWSGLYTQQEQSLYVNEGIGSVMIPFRFGAWPEITLIILKSEQRRQTASTK